MPVPDSPVSISLNIASAAPDIRRRLFITVISIIQCLFIISNLSDQQKSCSLFSKGNLKEFKQIYQSLSKRSAITDQLSITKDNSCSKWEILLELLTKATLALAMNSYHLNSHPLILRSRRLVRSRADTFRMVVKPTFRFLVTMGTIAHSSFRRDSVRVQFITSLVYVSYWCFM